MAREKAKDIWFGGATQVFFRWWEEVGGILFVGSFYCNFNFLFCFFFPIPFSEKDGVMGRIWGTLFTCTSCVFHNCVLLQHWKYGREATLMGTVLAFSWIFSLRIATYLFRISLLPNAEGDVCKQLTAFHQASPQRCIYEHCFILL